MKQLTPISKSLYFNALSSSYLDKFSMFYLQMNVLLTYNQNYCPAFFFETEIKAVTHVLRF